MMKTKSFPILLLFVLLVGISSYGMDVELVDVVKLSQEEDFIQLPTSFAVTEDHLYFILDKKAANIRIYNQSGKLVKIFGRKGIGPDEFQEPRYIDYYHGLLAIMDLVTRRIYVYSRAGKNGLKKEKDFLCISLGDDLCIRGDRIMIAGYKRDQNDRPYSLYIRNYRNSRHEFLLPSEMKYGFDSVTEYQNEFRKDLKIAPMGIQSYIAWLGDDVYFVWQGNLKIIKINVRTKERSFFGKHTRHYTQPKASRKMIDAYKRRDTREWLKERHKLCYVSDIFVAPEYIMVKYLRPGKGQGPQSLRARLQFYTPEGTFINEVELPRKEYNLYYFKRDEEILYVLSLETTEELKEVYSMYRYRIVR